MVYLQFDLDVVVSGNSNKHIFSCLVKSIPVDLEISCTVVFPLQRVFSGYIN